MLTNQSEYLECCLRTEEAFHRSLPHAREVPSRGPSFDRPQGLNELFSVDGLTTVPFWGTVKPRYLLQAVQ